MSKTTKSDVVIADLWNDALEGAFAQKNAFFGSKLAATGVVLINSGLEGATDKVGETVKVPYFGVIGEFSQISSDGDSLTPKKIKHAAESATVQHWGLAFQPTRWAQSAKARNTDLYKEGARQTVEAASRCMDSVLMTEACKTGGLVKDVFSSGSPRYLDYQLVVQARMMWDDAQDDIAGMIVHSLAFSDLLTLLDSNGNPQLTNPTDGSLPRFCGMPLIVSDRTPLDGSTMGDVTATGTTPPTVTLSGTPNANHNLVIAIETGGARGTATFKFSTDGGVNWSAEMLTAASVSLDDSDTADSLVGVNGKTGITAVFANSSYNADNEYTSTANLKLTSLLCKPGSLAFYYDEQALMLQTDRDILDDTDVASMHLYAAPHRYRRYKGGTKSGIVRIRHNGGLPTS